jgi:hypothetical protein
MPGFVTIAGLQDLHASGGGAPGLERPAQLLFSAARMGAVYWVAVVLADIVGDTYSHRERPHTHGATEQKGEYKTSRRGWGFIGRWSVVLFRPVTPSSLSVAKKWLLFRPLG